MLEACGQHFKFAFGSGVLYLTIHIGNIHDEQGFTCLKIIHSLIAHT